MDRLTDFQNPFTKWFVGKFSCVYMIKISASRAICCYTALWNLKIKKCYWFWQHLQHTACGHVSGTLWALEHLTVVRQTVSRLLTLIDWLTFLKLVRRRLESTVERCSAERCCVMVMFSPLLHAHARVRFARVRFHLTSVSFLGFMFYTLNCSCVFFPNKDAFNHLRTVFILCYTSYVVHV